ncbi:MAG TPA: M48 family metallopeptidase [Terriglobales bacterium]|nr:M48 family metallopeptidase [Terriglobales bacterium]
MWKRVSYISAPEGAQNVMKNQSSWTRAVAIVLVLLLAAPAELSARYQPKYGFNLFSREDEVTEGRKAAAEIEKELPILPESDPVTRYVQHLGAQLAQNTPEPQYPYTFKVVNQKEINAFALPGGPIYVNLGTIQAADNEAELAGVMGHEISHVVMRHSTEQASKAMLAQLPLAILGGRLGGGIGGQLAQLGIVFGLNSVFLKYSRDAEREADLVGAGIIHDAGYNPHAVVTFFEKLQAESGGGRGAEFFNSHPNPGNRAKLVGDEVATLPSRNYRGDSSEFRDVKRRVATMKPLTAKEIAAGKGNSQPGQGQAQGSGTIESVARAEVMPSRTLQLYEHAAFRIRRPANWQVSAGQQEVNIAPPAGRSGEATAYGVILGVATPKTRQSLDDTTRQLVQGMLQGNPEHRQTVGAERIRVNGVPGMELQLEGPSPVRGQRERNWVIVLDRGDGSVLYAVFVGPTQDYQQLQPTFVKMLKSLRLR